MRGARLDVAGEQALEGIIPAYAGSTLSWKMLVMMEGDHPRVCGEHFPDNPFEDGFGGSSPRMRGALGFRA